MSRSNTNYWNLCERDEDGGCARSWHRSWHRVDRECYFPAVYETRRGLYHRKKRFPAWSWKRYSSGPPYEIKRIWQRQLRHRQDRDIRRYGEVLLDGSRWLAGMYSRWS